MTHHLHPVFSNVSARATSDVLTENPHPLHEEVDLNDIINALLQQYGLKEKSAILRLDKLVVVKGKKDQFTFLFGELLHAIFNHPPFNSKLFLFIQCAEEKLEEDILDLRSKTSGRYVICFHTNIHTDENWRAIHKSNLEECCRIVHENGGSLSQNNITNTGCLFSLTLPGKIQ
jgi:hypothetical protein